MSNLLGQSLGRYHILEQLGALFGTLREGWDGINPPRSASPALAARSLQSKRKD